MVHAPNSGRVVEVVRLGGSHYEKPAGERETHHPRDPGVIRRKRIVHGASAATSPSRDEGAARRARLRRGRRQAAAGRRNRIRPRCGRRLRRPGAPPRSRSFSPRDLRRLRRVPCGVSDPMSSDVRSRPRNQRRPSIRATPVPLTRLGQAPPFSVAGSSRWRRSLPRRRGPRLRSTPPRRSTTTSRRGRSRAGGAPRRSSLDCGLRLLARTRV
jgi:hypothetical protein